MDGGSLAVCVRPASSTVEEGGARAAADGDKRYLTPGSRVFIVRTATSGGRAQELECFGRPSKGSLGTRPVFLV